MSDIQYYYLNGTMKMGPFSFETLKHAPIKPDTMVWNNTLPDWVEARKLPELQAFFVSSNVQNVPPPYSAQPSGQATQANYSNPGNNYNMGANPYTFNSQHLPPMPDSYMVWAILTTLFCCLPLGIVSIINASKVSTAYAVGDYEGARKASEDAKKWATWSALAAVIAIALYILFYVFIFVIIGAAGVASGL